MREILRHFGCAQTASIHVYEDNLACVAMSEILFGASSLVTLISVFTLSVTCVCWGGGVDPSLSFSLP